MDDPPLLLVGASGLASEVAECARRVGRKVLGCFDDDPTRAGELLPGGVTVIGDTTALLRAAPPAGHPAQVVVTIGPSRVRRRVVERLRAAGLGEERFARLVDPQTVVPAGSSVGPGTVLLGGIVITAPIDIGSHVVVMPHVTLTHDDVIEDFATIAAGVNLGGGVRVAEEAYLGMGSSVRQHLTVGRGSVLGMGAVLLDDLPEGATWAGVPARALS